MSMLPFYFIAIVVALYSALTYGVYLPAFYTYVRNKARPSKSNNQLTEALQQLINAPSLGQFFYQDLITIYVLKNQWEKVLNYSTVALESPINEHSYSIWYYKATAQCLLHRLQDCQRSARIANSLSPHTNEDNTSQLFNLIKIMRENQNIKLVSDKNQIMIILDASNKKQKLQKPASEGQQAQKGNTISQEQSQNSRISPQQEENSQNAEEHSEAQEIHLNLAEL